MNLEFDIQLMEEAKFFTAEERLLLAKEIEDGYVSCKKHPDSDIYIYNYTNLTEWEWRWNSITTRCRGLILDSDGCLVAKGFDKFFTYDQLKDENKEHLIPTDEKFYITDKVDGSMGLMYFVDDMHYIATRGSFISEMAVEANKMLRDQYGHIVFYPEYSYRFEIIYPENRIIVDYGNERKLVLLSVMNNRTQHEMNLHDQEFDYIEEQGMERAEEFCGTWDDILEAYKDDTSREGFVVFFPNSGFRLKLKLDWYKNATYVAKHYTRKNVWRAIRDGENIGEIIGNIDDKHIKMRIMNYGITLMDEYNKILKYATAVHEAHKDWMGHVPDYTMKQFVIELKKYIRDPLIIHLVLSLENGDDVFRYIWRAIEPVGSDHLVN